MYVTGLSSVCCGRACMVDMPVWMLVLGSAEPLCMQQWGILPDNCPHSRISPADVKCLMVHTVQTVILDRKSSLLVGFRVKELASILCTLQLLYKIIGHICHITHSGRGFLKTPSYFLLIRIFFLFFLIFN